MAIDNKDLFVWLKSVSRGQALPLDESEIHDSLEDAQLYSSSPNAYGGQTIKALLNDGKYHQYVLQPSDTGYVLEEAAIKSYVDILFARIAESLSTPTIVDSTHHIPYDYVAGKTYRVAENGNYVGQECEVGDLILVVTTYNESTASDSDFIVLQANIDGAVTSAADSTAVGEIVMFDSVTGKVITGSSISVDSLNDVIFKSHEHFNKDVLDTYNQTQAQIFSEMNKKIISALTITEF